MRRRIAVVIPARFAASRLPGKPLLDLGGKPMIQHVYERASLAQVDRVVVATDDERIFEVVKAFGGQVVMTSNKHVSGTDRVAEAALTLDVDIVVNVQGDEPLLDPTLIDLASAPLWESPQLVMSTVAHPIHTFEDLDNPNVVKVVCDKQGFALYFSRSPIPFDRDRFDAQSGHNLMDNQPPKGVLRHVGLYVYRADFLQTFAKLPPTELEMRERLEQLRVLEQGYKIRVVLSSRAAIGVDTPADLQRVRQWMNAS